MVWKPVIQMEVLKIGSGIVSAPWTAPQVLALGTQDPLSRSKHQGEQG